MNYRVVVRTLGMMLIIVGTCMTPMYIVGIYYHDDASLTAIMLVSMCMVMTGMILRSVEKRNETLRIREGYLIVVLTWIITCFCCSLPYFVSGCIPNLADAIFEGTSGITTTGASILTDIESLPKTMLFWRAYTHWMAVGASSIISMTDGVSTWGT